jgi:tetratricopeptide (TPR) repeat protein
VRLDDRAAAIEACRRPSSSTTRSRRWYEHRLHGLPITADDVVSAFEGAWSSEGFFSREHEERRLAEGRDALRRFVAREDAANRPPLAVEAEFKFRIGPDWVVGRWDRIDEALEGFGRALRFDPEHPAALFHTGDVLARKRRFEDAVEAWDKVSQIDPAGPFAAPARSRALGRDLRHIFAAQPV